MVQARTSHFSTDAQHPCKLGSQSAYASEDGGAPHHPHTNMEKKDGYKKKKRNKH